MIGSCSRQHAHRHRGRVDPVVVRVAARDRVVDRRAGAVGVQRDDVADHVTGDVVCAVRSAVQVVTPSAAVPST